MRNLILLLTISISLFMWVVPNSLAIVIKMNFEDLTINSHKIIIGTIISKESKWNEEHTNIFTYFTVEVEQVLKGSVDSPTITLKQIGGKVGDIEQIVSDTVPIEIGKRVLLFIDDNGIQTDLMGWFQGMWILSNGNAYNPKTGEIFSEQEVLNRINKTLLK